MTYLLDRRFQQNTRYSDLNGLQRNVRDSVISDISTLKNIPKKEKDFRLLDGCRENIIAV